MAERFNKIGSWLAIAALSLSIQASAQIIPSGATVVQGTSSVSRGDPVKVQLTDGNGVYTPVGGGGGGGGDASAANQVITNNRLGDTSAPAAGSINAQLAQIKPVTYQLLTNASATGSTVNNVNGGGYLFAYTGTFGGATITLRVSDAAGALQNVVSVTSAGSTALNIGQDSSVQAVVSGGSPSALYASIQSVNGPIASSSSGDVALLITPVSTLTLPTTTTTYNAGALVGSNATAASVVFSTLSIGTTTPITLRGCTLTSNNNTVTNAVFRIFFYPSTPTTTVGDAGAANSFETTTGVVSTSVTHTDYMDIIMNKATAAGATGRGLPSSGDSITLQPGATMAWAAEALAAYARPANTVLGLQCYGTKS